MRGRRPSGIQRLCVRLTTLLDAAFEAYISGLAQAIEFVEKRFGLIRRRQRPQALHARLIRIDQGVPRRPIKAFLEETITDEESKGLFYFWIFLVFILMAFRDAIFPQELGRESVSSSDPFLSQPVHEDGETESSRRSAVQR